MYIEIKIYLFNFLLFKIKKNKNNLSILLIFQIIHLGHNMNKKKQLLCYFFIHNLPCIL
jgi:hypothetical protein